MTPSKPKTAITVGIGVAPKSRSPLPSTKNPFADLMSKPDESSTDPTQAGGKEDVLSQGGAKVSRDDAGFIAAGQKCGACTNYTRETKDCAKVDGSFETGDSCSQFFEAVPGHEVGGDDDALLAGIGGGSGKIGDSMASAGAGKSDAATSALGI